MISRILLNQYFGGYMAINDTEMVQESILNASLPRTIKEILETIGAQSPPDFAGILAESAVGRYLAFLAMHARITTAAALNESDCARAVIDALSDHINFFSTVELNEFFAKEIARILTPKYDLHILCGHLKIVLEDSNHEHKDKIIKFFKSVICQ